MLFSSSECITWFAVTLTVFVAIIIVTVNLLSIVLFIKNRSLRTRAMYLVISLTVADMFVGGFCHFFSISTPLICICMRHCENELKPGTGCVDYLSLLLVSSDLSNKHCSHFIGSAACNYSSLQASPHQNVGLRGNNCWCLGFSCNGINCNFNSFSICGRTVISVLRMAIIQLFVSICYLCFLLFHCLVWSASSAPWCSQQTKETDRNIIHNDYRILTDVATTCGFWFSLLSIFD